MKVRKLLLGLTAILLTGCASVNKQGPPLVTKPGMQFSRSSVYAYSSKPMPQFLPGLPASGGNQPSTCTLCR